MKHIQIACLLFFLASSLNAQYYTIYQSSRAPREKIIFLDTKQEALIIREKAYNDLEKPLVSIPIAAIDSIAYYPPPKGYAQPIGPSLMCGFALLPVVYIYSESKRLSEFFFNIDKVLKASLTGVAVGGIAWLCWELMSNMFARRNKIVYHLDNKNSSEKKRMIDQIVADYQTRVGQESKTANKEMVY